MVGPLVEVDNDTAYASYRFVVTEVRDSDMANSMQFADIQFYVPEPTSAALLLGGVWGLTLRRRSRCQSGCRGRRTMRRAASR